MRKAGHFLMYTLPNGTLVDLDALELAMLASDPSGVFGSDEYLCLDTGAIITLANLGEQEREDILYSNHHALIPPISSDEAYGWREEFVDQVVAPRNPLAAKHLARALRSKGPFRRFQEALHSQGDDWVQQWDQWEGDHLHDHLHSRLASLPSEIEDEDEEEISPETGSATSPVL